MLIFFLLDFFLVCALFFTPSLYSQFKLKSLLHLLIATTKTTTTTMKTMYEFIRSSLSLKTKIASTLFSSTSPLYFHLHAIFLMVANPTTNFPLMYFKHFANANVQECEHIYALDVVVVAAVCFLSNFISILCL